MAILLTITICLCVMFTKKKKKKNRSNIFSKLEEQQNQDEQLSNNRRRRKLKETRTFSRRCYSPTSVSDDLRLESWRNAKRFLPKEDAKG